MRFTRLVAASIRTMVRYKLRSSFIMVGSLVGVAAMTLVISVGTGVERKILGTVRALFSPASIMITSGEGFILAGPRGNAARLTIDDLEAVAAAVPEVTAWDPVQLLPDANARYGDASSSARVLGCSERFVRVWSRGAAQGELFDAAAVARAARVAVIGRTTARELFGDAEPLGAEILIGNVPLRVIGILESLGTDAHGMDRDAEVVVPISTMMRRVLNVDTLRGARVLVAAPEQAEQAAREIAALLRERHGLAAGQPNDFTIITALEVQKMVASTQRVLFVFLPLVAIVALLVVALVAASLMMLSVNQRVGEIGIRRAVGARPAHIAAQFLLETTVTTVVGALVGAALGAAASLLVADRIGLDSAVSVRGVLLGLALAAVTGLAAGVLPARRAAALPPAEALR